MCYLLVFRGSKDKRNSPKYSVFSIYDAQMIHLFSQLLTYQQNILGTCFVLNFTFFISCF